MELTAHGAHYSLEEVKDFVKFCESLNMEVIPLVQTFGHLEYVLKVRNIVGGDYCNN